MQFEHVFKKYRLGLTRTSISILLSNQLKQIAGRKYNKASNQDFWALKDISFTLLQGESLALAGRNGAGKTAILKLLANIDSTEKSSCKGAKTQS